MKLGKKIGIAETRLCRSGVKEGRGNRLRGHREADSEALVALTIIKTRAFREFYIVEMSGSNLSFNRSRCVSIGLG